MYSSKLYIFVYLFILLCPGHLLAGGRTLSRSFKTKVTYYWTVFPEKESKSLVDVRGPKGKLIDRAPISLMKKIAIEGSGFLPPSKKHPKGLLINLACACSFKKATYLIVDRKVSQWGLDSTGGSLVPFKSIAVDPNVIDLGTKIYIEQFDGIKIGPKQYHNGCVVATDTGYSIKGKHIDVFTGTKAKYKQFSKRLKYISEVKLFLNSNKCKR